MVNNLIPYRDRKINLDRPVQIYRNLNRPDTQYSIRQDGLVRAHTDQISLRDCRFVVQPGGRRRYLETKTRTVYAWIEGRIGPDIGTVLPWHLRYHAGDEYFLAGNDHKAYWVTRADLLEINKRKVTCYGIWPVEDNKSGPVR